MRRDIVFLSSKRFKFEKVEGNDFRLDGRQNGRSQRLKISNLSKLNLRSRVKENQNLSILFLKNQVAVFSYPKQART